MKAKLGKIVYSTKSNYIQLVGDVKFLNFVIFGGASVVQKEKIKCKCLKVKHLHFVVPRAGIEPARIAPLVFETSASTDSAIWAWCLGRLGAADLNRSGRPSGFEFAKILQFA